MVKIAASILSTDFSDLSITLDQCKMAAIDQIHIDVMDGYFVPNITIGPQVVKEIREKIDLPLDVHLMIEKPEEYIDQFIEAGSDMITIHVEACSNLNKVVDYLKVSGVKAGVSLKPSTSLSSIYEVLPTVDFVLVMSVEPGFGGQKFIPDSLDRIRELKSNIFTLLQQKYPNISVDGGIKSNNAMEIIAAGADILVIGSAIFKSKNPIETMKFFKQIL